MGKRSVEVAAERLGVVWLNGRDQVDGRPGGKYRAYRVRPRRTNADPADVEDRKEHTSSLARACTRSAGDAANFPASARNSAQETTDDVMPPKSRGATGKGERRAIHPAAPFNQGNPQ